MARKSKSSERESSGKTASETPEEDAAPEASRETDETLEGGEAAQESLGPETNVTPSATEDTVPDGEKDGDETPRPESEETAATEDTEPPADPFDTDPADDTLETALADDSAETDLADDTLDSEAAAGGRFDDTGTQAMSSATDDSLTPTEPAADREAPRQPPAEPPRPDPQPQSRGMLPLLLGGILAGLIGFGAAYYATSAGIMSDTADLEILRRDTEERLSEQSDRIAALSEQVGTVPEAPDMTGLEAAVDDLTSRIDGLAGRVEDHDARLEELSSKVSQLESRPIVEAASDAAVEAYEAELKKLQDAMAAQRAEIEAMTEEARALESKAEDTAQATLRRAALSRIQTALDSGGSFAAPLAELEEAGVEAPEILSQTAETGVATLAELQAQFPDAARQALAAAREAAADAGETGGWQAFLETQLGVRSLEPREGNDPDAILSRAEAATRDGRLQDALAEIEALPEAARAELSNWSEQAARRLEAVAAAQKLSEELN